MSEVNNILLKDQYVIADLLWGRIEWCEKTIKHVQENWPVEAERTAKIADVTAMMDEARAILKRLDV